MKCIFIVDQQVAGHVVSSVFFVKFSVILNAENVMFIWKTARVKTANTNNKFEKILKKEKQRDGLYVREEEREREGKQTDIIIESHAYIS